MKEIAMEKADPRFKYEIAGYPGAENIRKCFSCGTCTGACPVFQVEEEYNPRRLIRMILMGLREEVLTSKVIWLCARCYACTAHCPQGVSFADIMVVLRNLAIQEGHAPTDLPDKIEQLGRAAGEFRKNCINLVCGGAKVSARDVARKAKETVEKL
ncbi:MAG: 4Fe-4S dicluster domain-containing protein [Verrucomicrobiota bacterium]|nr:4Fe-4S dicluster domain-containing protein [Verrucomicrobiota bacterium]